MIASANASAISTALGLNGGAVDVDDSGILIRIAADAGIAFGTLHHQSAEQATEDVVCSSLVVDVQRVAACHINSLIAVNRGVLADNHVHRAQNHDGIIVLMLVHKHHRLGGLPSVDDHVAIDNEAGQIVTGDECAGTEGSYHFFHHGICPRSSDLVVNVLDVPVREGEARTDVFQVVGISYRVAVASP